MTTPKDMSEGRLHFAVEKDNANDVLHLIKHGSDLNERNIEGETPLTVAVKNESAEVVELLLKEGAEVNKSNLDLSIPIDIAVAKCNERILELLIEHGGDVNSVDPLDLTLLDRAETSVGAMEMVIKHINNSPNASDRAADLAKAEARKAELEPIVEMLIKAGARRSGNLDRILLK